MEQLKLIIKIFQKRYVFVVFNQEHPPTEGDTITAGEFTATFIRNEV